MTLYRKNEIPAGLKGRGVWWLHYRNNITGQEDWVFIPFGGTPKQAFDWMCKYCGQGWFLKQVREKYEHHCPRCGKWAETGLKFNGKQVSMEGFF